ncbi:MAG: hypothetical protein HY842_01335 [Bacteroidetes bacterium]|nr:hypothetical protein [Bacteroidota bacterium]
MNYNFKDELIEKNFGLATSPPAPPLTTWWLQSLDYAYNSQGWLTTINGATLGGTNAALVACPTAPTAPNPGSAGSGTGNPDPNDLFYMELKYDGQFTGMTGDTLQKNGNINQMMWRTRGRERQFIPLGAYTSPTTSLTG